MQNHSRSKEDLISELQDLRARLDAVREKNTESLLQEADEERHRQLELLLGEMHKEQESLNAAVYQNTPLIMILLDEHRRVRRINRLACEYLGRPSGEILGKPCGEVLHCLHNQKDPKGCGNAAFCKECEVRLTVMDTLETGRNHHDVEASLPFEKNGVRKNLALLLYTTRIQFKKQLMVLVTILDISERKRSETALKESEALFRSLIEGAPDAVFVETNHRFAYMNASSVSLFGGESAAQLIGRESAERFHPDYRQVMNEHIRMLVQENKPFHSNEQICLRLDGSRVPVEISAVPICFRGKKGALVFVRDVTERKKAEEERCFFERQVRQTQRLESLSVLAGGIAHDFNNILMIVMGHAELALRKISQESEAQGNLQEIIHAAHRAADLCRQMLAYAGKAPAVFEKTDLSGLVHAMRRYLATSISKKITLKFHLEQDLPPVYIDPGQIRQIVMNLVLNASEAIGDQSGVIAVNTGIAHCDEDFLSRTALDNNLPPGVYVCLEITDTGCGIETDKQEHIFDPFYSTKFTGRGLGLAAVMGIVRTHKGALQVYSEHDNGTTFNVYFPAMENDGSDGASKKASPSFGRVKQSGSKTILFADDEESLRGLGKRMLEMLGFNVLTASDGKEAVDIYSRRKNEIGLVLLDLTMPHMDGAQAFSEIRKMNPSVGVVLASGYSEEDVSSRFAGKGLAGVLQKPYTMIKLKKLLSNIFNGVEAE